ncbi:hypothetical protein N8I74_15380 [Chitiniphilus purpureus]|uniref:Uncharacterized protein n=1 Tax=Chitiniphilus purpureus TaxID=2981137 RepID=A0ABY6DK08_9NEIS|nr:hypothetical protein [Chitiniphilus sp. CD1]UXY14686.1 hypothetical protein N8I74_15380 [Chitiniphilus sp. CD1]
MTVLIDQVDSEVTLDAESPPAAEPPAWQVQLRWREAAELAARDARRTSAWGSED